MNQLDIRRLRKEAEHDLDALTRVEAMLARDSAKPDKGAIRKVSDVATVAKPAGSNTGLKRFVASVVGGAGSGGFRTRDVTAAVIEKGYTFRNSQTASASVSTALRRLRAAGLVERKTNGRYIWIDKDS